MASVRSGGGDLVLLDEDFSGPTFPPAGWAVFDLDGDNQTWRAAPDDDPPTDTLAYSRYSAGASVFGQDYLATPLLSITEGVSTLSFEAAQQYVPEYGSQYSVLVSNASEGGTQTDAESYSVIATYTEGDFPVFGEDGTALFELDLSAYTGDEIYVAFLHENADGDNFLLDDVGGVPLVVLTEPVLEVNPEGPVAFLIPTGVSRSEDVTVRNAGGGTLEISSFQLVGEEGPFSLSSRAGTSLGAGESTTVTVSFDPAEEGDYVAVLQILGPGEEVLRQVAFAGSAFTGVAYDETESGGDCGSFVDAACEVPNPNDGARAAAYTAISGELASGADTDLYIITFLGGRFTASTVGGASFDTELFLLDDTGAIVEDDAGNPIGTNDDAGGGPLQSTIDIPVTPTFQLPAGQYYLGIGAYDTVYQEGPPSGITSNSTATTARPYVISIGNGNVVPVEMTTFASRVDGDAVVLEWATASETNNAGFDVQVRRPGADTFETVSFVNGHGTTTEAQTYAFRVDGLQPGTHRFRLRQVDLDGQATLTNEVEASVALDAAFTLAAARPNPFSQTTRFELAVQQAQDVQVAVYDVLGREVVRLHDGAFEAQSSRLFELPAAQMAAGTYVVRVQGERFAETMRVTVVR